ncbi:MAG TPA: DUF2795 domain-containing protein [Pseudonocardiaceae bacterium]|jgi:hypothetical protein|nr:DUF2795 domain-containing protein [Pseudonocardiaceae bacterium]
MSKPNPIQLQKHLSGVDYPADKNQLIEKARQNGADEDTIKLLQKLPDRTYDGPNKVSQAITQTA